MVPTPRPVRFGWIGPEGVKMAEKRKIIVLDEYEKDILTLYEDGRLKPAEAQADYQKIAKNTLKKSRKIKIKISENDLSALQ